MTKGKDWKDAAFERCFGRPRNGGAVTVTGFDAKQVKRLARQLKTLAKSGITQSRWIFC